MTLLIKKTSFYTKLIFQFAMSFLICCNYLFGSDVDVVLKVRNSKPNIGIIYSISQNSIDQEPYFNSLAHELKKSLSLSDRLEVSVFEQISSLEKEKMKYLFNKGISHIVFMQQNQIHISTKVYSLYTNSVQTLSDRKIHMSEALDKCTIHNIADLSHKIITKVQGISSSHITYTNKNNHNNEEESSLWIMDIFGNNKQCMIKNSSLILSPHLISSNIGSSPTHILYVSYKNKIPKIILHNISTSKGTNLIPIKGNQFMPAMSISKDKIAFISDLRGNPDLYLQNFSPNTGLLGKPLQLLNHSFGSQGNPSFSPNGSELVFVSNKNGVPRLYIMQLEPVITAPKLLFKKHKEALCPAWSPDGTKIAYCTITKNIRQIWIHDRNLEEEVQITFSTGDKESPSWAPDSSHIVYSSKENNSSDLYVVSILSKTPKKITQGPGEKRFPFWEQYSS